MQPNSPSPPPPTLPEAPVSVVYAKSIWPIATTIGSALLAVAGGSFYASSVLTKAEVAAELTAAKEKVERAETKATALQERNASLQADLAKLTADNASLSKQLSEQSMQVGKLSSQITAENNCDFIHEQIRKLETELRSDGIGYIFASETEKDVAARHQREQERRASIDQRIARYQSQLGPGACK